MASGSSLLSEDQFLCPICLDLFTKPVSTPCGHNFCMSCLTGYWNDLPVSQCPVCKEHFQKKPNLKVNTFISELVSQFKSLQVDKGPNQSADQPQVGSGVVVQCDFCTDPQRAAVKSCLECLVSYCDDHLKPHYIASGLKEHTLVEPVVNLVNKVCKKHQRLLQLFCRNNTLVLCDLCVMARHMNHDVVPLQRGYDEMKDLLGQSEVKVQRMIQERLQKVQNMNTSVTQSRTEANELISNSTQDLTQLLFEIKKIQEELVKVVEEKQKTAEEEAERFISDMEREISDLQETANKMEELKQTKDQLYFLQHYPNKSSLPQTTDQSTFRFTRHLAIQHMHTSFRKSVSQLRGLLSQMNEEIHQFSISADASDDVILRDKQQYEVNIVLDPDTAHPLLSLSPNRKQVMYNTGRGFWGNQILKPSMFTSHLAVLGQRSFSSCNFYFEVHVGQKTEWCLGMATASIQRMGALVRNSDCGLWAIWFLLDKFETFCSPGVSVHVGKTERVGVFVDYDQGLISFFDVVRSTQIYSFTECFFTEQLYPYFNPCDNEYGSNLGPMTIVPVGRSD